MADELIGAYLLGRCANECERDKGVLVHAVGGRKLLCGKEPGRRSAGWALHSSQVKQLDEVNCPQCAKKLKAA